MLSLLLDCDGFTFENDLVFFTNDALLPPDRDERTLVPDFASEAGVAILLGAPDFVFRRLELLERDVVVTFEVDLDGLALILDLEGVFSNDGVLELDPNCDVGIPVCDVGFEVDFLAETFEPDGDVRPDCESRVLVRDRDDVFLEGGALQALGVELTLFTDVLALTLPSECDDGITDSPASSSGRGVDGAVFTTLCFELVDSSSSRFSCIPLKSDPDIDGPLRTTTPLDLPRTGVSFRLFKLDRLTSIPGADMDVLLPELLESLEVCPDAVPICVCVDGCMTSEAGDFGETLEDWCSSCKDVFWTGSLCSEEAWVADTNFLGEIVPSLGGEASAGLSVDPASDLSAVLAAVTLSSTVEDTFEDDRRTLGEEVFFDDRKLSLDRC